MTGFGESSYRRDPSEDPRELERLVRTYAQPLVRYAYSIVECSATAEDVMEDAFVQLLLHRGSFHDEAALRAWLYRVVHSKAVDYLRRHRRFVPLEDVEQVLSTDGPEAAALDNARNATLYLCLQKLPKQYREVLQLKYLDDFKIAQIAAITGTSVKQVYNALERGRIALRESMMKEGFSYENL